MYDSADKCWEEDFNETSSYSGSVGDSCQRVNTCFDTDEPTILPTPAPTSHEYERRW